MATRATSAAAIVVVSVLLVVAPGAEAREIDFSVVSKDRPRIFRCKDHEVSRRSLAHVTGVTAKQSSIINFKTAYMYVKCKIRVFYIKSCLNIKKMCCSTICVILLHARREAVLAVGEAGVVRAPGGGGLSIRVRLRPGRDLRPVGRLHLRDEGRLQGVHLRREVGLPAALDIEHEGHVSAEGKGEL